MIKNFTYKDDRQLVTELMQGSEGAVEYVFYTHYSDLLKKNFSMTCSKTHLEYDDLVQDLFFYLRRDGWHVLQRYDESYPFVGWFSVVSYRFFKDQAKKVIDYTDEIPICDISDKSMMLSTRNTNPMVMHDIKEAIASLATERDREVIQALVVEEKDPTEVAKKHHVTVDNLYNIKRRALAQLIKKHLSDYR